MAQLAVVLLVLFGQMERTYAVERAAHARFVATAKGRRIGRPTVVAGPRPPRIRHLLRDQGATIADIVAKTGIARTTLPPPATNDGSGLLERRHCRNCQPHTGVATIACTTCGDRPLLVNLGPTARSVSNWIAATKWRATPEPLCPKLAVSV